jgi:hypothetical protein
VNVRAGVDRNLVWQLSQMNAIPGVWHAPVSAVIGSESVGCRHRRTGARPDGGGGPVASGICVCHHPDGATRLIASALTAFRHDAGEHAHGRRCAGARQRTIPVPGVTW